MSFDTQSITSSCRQGFERPGSDIQICGYLKKLKTGKRRYFVLRSTSSSGPARLDYFENEKKFKSGVPPKRSIHLHTCFNINKSSDLRPNRHGVVLHTSDDCFTVLAASQDEQEEWLKLLLEFQNQYLPSPDMYKDHYDHVWQVTLKPMGLGQSLKSKGHYRVCLNASSVCIVKSNSSIVQFAILLPTIRTVAHNDCSLRLEVGKMALTGEGEFWFSVDDASTAKHMHETLLHYMNSVKNTNIRKDSGFRKRSDSHSAMSPSGQRTVKTEVRPVSYYPPPSTQNWLETSMNPHTLSMESHRPRSNTAESKSSRASSHHDDGNLDMIGSLNGDGYDPGRDLTDSIPLSPQGLDEEMNDYLAMDARKLSGVSGIITGATPPSSLSTYLPMNLSQHSHTSSKGEHSSPVGSQGSTSSMGGYMSMSPLVGTPPPFITSAPIPIHGHSFSEPHQGVLHTILPTVREGGSSEGCLPMDLSTSSHSGPLRPEPATCMLTDDSSNLPPRTYSLGSRPGGKKHSGSSYVDMAPNRGSTGPDMSRASSAPHIIHHLRAGGRRDHPTDSPTPSASPLSTSIKSDDSDSFMDQYVPMRPRTSSDSFNYRHRTSSFGKMQPVSRPRSSSHGQGTRPIIKFTKLASSRHEQKVSQESSLHNSFDSLRMSQESLRRGESHRRASHDLVGRQTSGSNASDYADARSTPSPQLRRGGKPETAYMSMQPGGTQKEADTYMSMTPGSRKESDSDSYMSMTPGSREADGGSYMSMTPGGSDSGAYLNMNIPTGRRTSPHRVRTDSSGSGRRSESRISEDKPYFCGPQSQQGDDYTEMGPLSMASSASSSHSHTDSYMNMDFVKSNHTKPAGCPSLGSNVTMGKMSGSDYLNMDLKKKETGQGRSVSLENVDSSYIVYDPAHPQTDSTYVMYDPSQGTKPRTGSLGAKDKQSRGPGRKGSGTLPNPNRQSVSAASRKGGSSDSLRKASRQSSMEKTGSLGKDFRKKSGSTGTRPDQGKGPVLIRRVPSNQVRDEEPNDEYIEFDPSVTVESLSAGRNIQTEKRGQTSSRTLNQDTYMTYAPAATKSDNILSPHSPHSLAHSSHSLATQPHVSHSFTSHTSPNPTTQPQTSHISQSLTPATKGLNPQTKSPGQRTTSKSILAKPPVSVTHVKSKSADDTSDYVGYQPGSSDNYVGYKPSSSDYVGYQPGVPLPTPEATPPPTSTKTKHVESKESPVYVGFDPAGNNTKTSGHPAHPVPPVFHPTPHIAHSTPHTAHPTPNTSHPTPLKSYVTDQSDYVTYQPAPKSGRLTSPVVSPQLAVSSAGQTKQTTKDSTSKQTATSTQQIRPENSRQNSSILKNSSSSKSAKDQKVVSGGQDKKTPAGDTSDYLDFSPSLPSTTPSSMLKENTAPSTSSFPNLQSPTCHISSEPVKTAPERNPEDRKSGCQKFDRQLSTPDEVKTLRGKDELEKPAPLTGTRLKHNSGGPTVPSQKSGKTSSTSSDSDKPLRKGSKSDSNSSLSSLGKNKTRIASGEKSPLESSERSPLSPSSKGSGEFFPDSPFSGGLSGKELEGKMVPVEAKIRLSLGDMTAVVVNKDVATLSRPGSTPCMQNLEPVPDNVSRSSEDDGSDPANVGQRTRHSLSDLGAYQQMNFPAKTSSSSSVDASGDHGNAAFGSGINAGSRSTIASGSSDSSSGDMPPKPLNYVALDMSCMDSSSESGRVKSRHSSDADERQSPLSYAEIDFVKSQNLSQALALSQAADSSSSNS